MDIILPLYIPEKVTHKSQIIESYSPPGARTHQRDLLDGCHILRLIDLKTLDTGLFSEILDSRFKSKIGK